MMSSTEVRSEPATEIPRERMVDMKLEVVVIPVSDVAQAKRFYQGLEWREDVDVAGPHGYHAVHLTPPGSNASILIGNKGVTSAEPGSIAGLLLTVDDIDAARAELISHGVDVSEVFHDVGGSLGGGFIAAPEARAPGHDPQRRSYASYASFSDSDGNGWLLQEVTTRLPGRIDSNATTFASARDLASALRRAAAAHGEHEKRTGQHDADWPDWYAAYMVAEQSGDPLPS
jgi:catechol 2,3-dioxygenase-like lactoylglutathione lyase family enzyme